jgi:1,4-dihydroxy-6-naphthoate synthase
VEGLLKNVPQVNPVLADVQHLNEWMLKSTYPLTKASIAAFRSCLSEYVMLPVGAALGYGNGPKIISKKHFSLNELSQKRVAIPGVHTTAYHLMRRLCPQPRVEVFTSYEHIIPLIERDEVDCGLIIHETRFTFQEKGLVEIVDLGELWQQKMNLPLPLGGFFAKRILGKEMLNQLTNTLRLSLQHAWKNPQDSKDYVLKHSQEKDTNIVAQHIDLYVTKDTYDLSSKGIQAIEQLLGMQQSEWLWKTES